MLKRTGILALMWLVACGPLHQNAQYTAEGLNTMKNDTREAWNETMTYHPRKGEQLPQTRYCYRMQSDVVCYDSPQNNLTAKLVGYQDGQAISWVQPGGGSLGASGGEPTAPNGAATIQVAPNVAGSAAVITTATASTPNSVDTSTSPVSSSNVGAPSGSDCNSQPNPFYCGQSPYVKN